MTDVLEWAGTITVIMGALLVAHQGRWMVHGFVLFLASNVFWTGYAIETNAMGLVTTQAVFAAINLFGLRQRLRSMGVPERTANVMERLLCPWRSS